MDDRTAKDRTGRGLQDVAPVQIAIAVAVLLLIAGCSAQYKVAGNRWDEGRGHYTVIATVQHGVIAEADTIPGIWWILER